MNKRVSTKILAKEKKLRGELWPDVTEDELWIRTEHKGFTTIPRTFPLIGQIMNSLSPGKPLTTTYLALWSRVFDSCMLKIEIPKVYAFESGFSGNRMETTWISRMRVLKELGFIESREGASGEFNFVLILNPYKVIKKLDDDGKINNEIAMTALRSRASEVGAKEF